MAEPSFSFARLLFGQAVASVIVRHELLYDGLAHHVWREEAQRQNEVVEPCLIELPAEGCLGLFAVHRRPRLHQLARNLCGRSDCAASQEVTKPANLKVEATDGLYSWRDVKAGPELCGAVCARSPEAERRTDSRTNQYFAGSYKKSHHAPRWWFNVPVDEGKPAYRPDHDRHDRRRHSCEHAPGDNVRDSRPLGTAPSDSRLGREKN